MATGGIGLSMFKDCYEVICQRLTMELLSPMAVMSEGLGFNLCVAPFLNVCVLNLPQGVEDRECRRWLGLGQRCHTRVLRVEVLALGCHMEGHLNEVS